MKKEVLVLVLSAALCFEAASAYDSVTYAIADNPDPENLPSLWVWEDYARKQDRYEHYLGATFPNIPEFTCDFWCFESPGIVFEKAEAIDGGRIRMTHSWEGEDWEIVTVATPERGAVEIVCHLEPLTGGNEKPDRYPNLNVCWQLRSATSFASVDEFYPEFVERCFMFTEKGRTFLHDTARSPIPRKRLDHKRNNPPWVQIYYPQSAPGEIKTATDSWSGTSSDRYTIPLIGAISKDWRYLTALATGSEGNHVSSLDRLYAQQRQMAAYQGWREEGMAHQGLRDGERCSEITGSVQSRFPECPNVGMRHLIG